MPSDYFHSLPLPVIYGFSVFLVLVSLWGGVLLGRRYEGGNGWRKDSSSTGSAVVATLGLLAFLLAFTFNMTAERYNQRKALLLDEVNAISTTYLRADFLSPAGGARARALLAEYARVRDYLEETSEQQAYGPGSAEDTARRVQLSEQIQRALWQLVEEHIHQGYDAEYLRQFVEPLNQMIDLHNSRVTIGSEYRIPGPIWAAVYFMTVLAMLVLGFQFGTSSGGSLQVALALALTFATVILLIADLDRTYEGTLVVDQTPMSKLNLLLQQSERERLRKSSNGDRQPASPPGAN